MHDLGQCVLNSFTATDPHPHPKDPFVPTDASYKSYLTTIGLLYGGLSEPVILEMEP